MNSRKRGSAHRVSRKSRHAAPERRSVLFVARCEGITDKHYLLRLAKELGLKKYEVQIEVSGAPRTCAEKLRDYLTDELGDEHDPEDRIAAIVVDRDIHPNVPEARDIARTNGFRFVLSNPCIELWFLMHFVDQRAPIERDKAEASLKRHLASYVKGKAVDTFPQLYEPENRLAACKRAATLRKHWDGDSTDPHERNPYTDMDLLLEEIAALARRAGGRLADQ